MKLSMKARMGGERGVGIRWRGGRAVVVAKTRKNKSVGIICSGSESKQFYRNNLFRHRNIIFPQE